MRRGINLKLKNKRGLEHFQLIVNNIFYIMMLVIGLVLVTNSLASMKQTYEFRWENMKFNNYVSRIMYSGDCFAYEEAYLSELGVKYRVYPATMDISKLKPARLSGCLVGLSEGKDYEVAVAEINETDTSNLKIGATHYASVRKKEGGSYIETCNDKEEWGRVATFFVDIRTSAGTKKGVLKFCYG